MIKNIKLPMVLLLLMLCAPVWADNPASPADGYQVYRQVMLKAARLSDLDPYLTKRMIASHAEVRKHMPPDVDYAKMETAMLRVSQKNEAKIEIKSVVESKQWPRGLSVAGNVIAIIDVDGMDRDTQSPMHAMFAMELEDGVWKYAGMWASNAEKRIPETSAQSAATPATR